MRALPIQAREQERPAAGFGLNPDLDVEGLAAAYAATGRIRIHRFLAEQGLPEFYDNLCERDDWWHLMNGPDGIVEIDRATRAGMSEADRRRLDDMVDAGARTGFQYRYEGLRVPEGQADPAMGADPLDAFAELMSSEPMLKVLRVITGCGALSFTDGQATAYGPGDFLTRHDDDVPGKNRVAAYVFGLTPNWRPEWGGILTFHGSPLEPVIGHVPRFNTLDLFAVPQDHSVSYVSPAAPRRRFAVTGWLRTGER